MADAIRAIAVDWGTSRLRAYALADDGRIVDEAATDQSLMAVPAGGFAAVLEGQIVPWRAAHPTVPVVMGGMVGSRQGWIEAPYVECPADFH